MGITIEITEATETRPLGMKGNVCPHCGGTEADAFLRWRLRRALGMPVKSTKIRADYVCRSCHAVSTQPAPNGCRPPWLHLYGGWLMFAFPFVAGAIVLALVVPSPATRRSDPGEERARALQVLRKETLAKEQAAEKECEARVSSAIAIAFPRGLDDTHVRVNAEYGGDDGTVPVEYIGSIHMPRALADRSWPCPIVTSYPAEMNRTSYEELDAHYAHYEARVRTYAADVAALVPARRFYVIQNVRHEKETIGVVALITIDGKVEALARTRDAKDDGKKIAAALDRQIASWKTR